MTQIVQLQYPDETAQTKIVDDLTVLSRNIGQRGHRASAAFEDADFPGMRTKLVQRQVPVGSPVPDGLGDDQAIVEDGTAIEITGGSVTFTVVDGAITGGTFTPGD